MSFLAGAAMAEVPTEVEEIIGKEAIEGHDSQYILTLIRKN
jgi:hypothetical protein